MFASYDDSCEFSLEQVSIETTPSFDECRDGRPIVVEARDESGRAQLELLLVPSECGGIAIAVPLAVIVLVVIVVILAVPNLRSKILYKCK